jgi:hypothetical protein
VGGEGGPLILSSIGFYMHTQEDQLLLTPQHTIISVLFWKKPILSYCLKAGPRSSLLMSPYFSPQVFCWEAIGLLLEKARDPAHQ